MVQSHLIRSRKLLGLIVVAGTLLGSAAALGAGAVPFVGEVPVEPPPAAAHDAPALPPLEAPTGFEPYIFRPTGEKADPINLIFLHTDAATVSAAIERVLGWRPISASGMSFRKNGEGLSVRPTSRQLAADLSTGSRYHIRIQSVPITDTQTYVLASVHRDDTASCGHVGRGFDETRDLVARAFAEAGYRVQKVDLNNGASGAHCDGSRVAGDGFGVLIDLSSFPRVEPVSRDRVSNTY